MSYISEKIDKIHANTKEIKSTLGNTIMMLDDINSSLNADVQSKVEEAYQNGYKACMQENDFDSPCTSCEIYQRGVEDIWEAVRKMLCMSTEKVEECFGVDESIIWLFNHMNAAEAIEKLKAYEEKKANGEIKVGDIIANNTEPKLKVWVTYFDEIGFYGIAITDFGTVDEGQLYTSCSPKGWHKIGHFDIPKILEEMKE